MTDNTSCSVCCEGFNKSSRSEIKCNNCEYSICKTCARTYLTSITADPKCMNCNVAWDRNYMVVNLNRSYMDKEYRAHRKNVLVDAEMSKMPDTVAYAESVKESKALGKVNEGLRVEYKEMQRKMNEIQQKIYANEYKIRNPGAPTPAIAGSGERKQFIMACPHENCRGFLSSAYKCGLCNMHTCPDCLTIIGENKNEEHKCNEDNVKSAEMIKRETKPCPVCGERIFKINGCDQMYCTSIKKDGTGVCGTAFSWKTGRIETGTIHNPHYYQLQRANGGAPVRAPGDVLCGGVPDLRYFGQAVVGLFTKCRSRSIYQITNQNQDGVIHHSDLPLLEDVFGIHQFVSEINQYELANRRRQVTDLNDNRDIRVKYLLKEIDKNEMGTLVNKNDVTRQKQVELLNVMEILGVTGIETLNDIFRNVDIGNYRTTANGTIEYLQIHLYEKKIREMLQDTWQYKKNEVKEEIQKRIDHFKTVVNYCNQQFKIIGVTYNCTSPLIPDRAEVTFQANANPYDKMRAVWKFKSRKYCLKDLKN